MGNACGARTFCAAAAQRRRSVEARLDASVELSLRLAAREEPLRSCVRRPCSTWTPALGPPVPRLDSSRFRAMSLPLGRQSRARLPSNRPRPVPPRPLQSRAGGAHERLDRFAGQLFTAHIEKSAPIREPPLCTAMR